MTYSKSTPSKKVDVASRIAIASAKLSATGSFEVRLEFFPCSSRFQTENSMLKLLFYCYLPCFSALKASPASSKPQSTNSSFAVDLPELEEAKFDEEYDGFDSQEKSASKTANQRSQIDPKLEKTKPVDAASLFNALEKEARDPPASKETKQRVAAATPTMSATPQTKSTKEKPPKQGDLRSFFTKSSSDPSATAAGTTNSDDVSDTAETPRKKQKTKE